VIKTAAREDRQLHPARARMAEKKIGSKLLGLFVETDSPGGDEELPAKGGRSPADLVAEIAGNTAPRRAPPASGPMPAMPQGAPAAAPRNLPVPSGAPMDFEAVFREAGMDPADLDRVKKAEDLLRGLPSGTPDAVKRQIVEASLKAFGFDLAQIVASAQNQRKALDAYVRVHDGATQKAMADTQAEILKLNERIASLKADIEKRQAAQAGLSAQAEARKAEVQKVIEFFQAPQPAPGA